MVLCVPYHRKQQSGVVGMTGDEMAHIYLGKRYREGCKDSTLTYLQGGCLRAKTVKSLETERVGLSIMYVSGVGELETPSTSSLNPSSRRPAPYSTSSPPLTYNNVFHHFAVKRRVVTEKISGRLFQRPFGLCNAQRPSITYRSSNYRLRCLYCGA